MKTTFRPNLAGVERTLAGPLAILTRREAVAQRDIARAAALAVLG